MKIWRISKWRDAIEYVDLLNLVSDHLKDIRGVLDPSLADLANEIEIAYRFVLFALRKNTRASVLSALNKSLPIIDQESDIVDDNLDNIVKMVKDAIMELS